MPTRRRKGRLQLTYEEFSYAVQLVRETGFPVERTTEEAWPHFRGWRVNYESLAYRMADVVVAPRAPWSGERRHLPLELMPPARPPHRAPEGKVFFDQKRRPVTRSRPRPHARCRGIRRHGSRSDPAAIFDHGPAGTLGIALEEADEHMATVELDADFLALPLEAVRGAALERARALGCEHAEVRIERIRSQVARLRDGRLETSADDVELGVGLRVVHDGSFGFAATVELTCRRRPLASPTRRWRRRGPPLRPCSERVELADGAFARRVRLDLRLPPRPGRGPDGRQGGPARGLERAAAAAPRASTT